MSKCKTNTLTSVITTRQIRSPVILWWLKNFSFNYLISNFISRDFTKWVGSLLIERLNTKVLENLTIVVRFVKNAKMVLAVKNNRSNEECNGKSTDLVYLFGRTTYT